MSADGTSPLPTRVDLAVIGGGPAGLAAATEAARIGLAVALLDEQAAPGGQIYRAIDANRARGKSLDPDYARGGTLADAFRASGATALFDASVWLVEPDGTIGFTRDGAAHLVKASRVIVASGAMERPVPIPGWTTPGVMTVGAAQILLKTAGLAPQGKVWIAGSGPLLRLYAVQAIGAGGTIAGIIDTTPRANYRAALPHVLGALKAPVYLRKGLAWRRALKRAGMRWISGASDLRAEAGADGKLAAIAFRHGGAPQREAADTLLLHEGVVPNVQITRALGAEHDWDARQRAFRPRLDAWGNTTVDGIMVAGDGGGIVGARAAELCGRLAALEAARVLGRIDQAARDTAALPWQIELDRERAIRPFLEALFAPRRDILVPADDTIVCRCEEITAKQLREAVTLGCLGPNQLKSFTRCGMGPCQGRLCGLTVAEVIAAARGVPVPNVGYYRLRFPIKPLTLGELAALHAPSL
jgi:NADPH-dependent 2,4-dienoyl-CoA reductase/sulfur reductase-like enzyme